MNAIRNSGTAQDGRVEECVALARDTEIREQNMEYLHATRDSGGKVGDAGLPGTQGAPPAVAGPEENRDQAEWKNARPDRQMNHRGERTCSR